jgi:hypothetical protein
VRAATQPVNATMREPSPCQRWSERGAGRRRAPGTIVAAVQEGPGTTRYQWLLVVTIAAGLVGMHHLVAEPSGHAGHSAHTTPMILAASPGSSLMSPTPTEHSHAGPLAVNPVEASVTATAVQASHPCCGDPRDLGRCCFAVSTTTSALTTVLIFVAAWRRPWGPGHLLVGVGAVAARAPPTDSVRFTRLCVLMR